MDGWKLVWDDKSHCHYERVEKKVGRFRKKPYGSEGTIRNWLEGQRWYWFSINLSFIVFPWHWEMEWTSYKWGLNVKFGPFGILVLWN